MNEVILLVVSSSAILLAIMLGISIKSIAVKDEQMARIAGYIKSGALAYLKRQYIVLSAFIVAMFVLLAVVPSLGIKVSASFLAGAVFSTLAGYFGMRAAIIANVRTAEAAKQGLNQAFKVAFSGGSIMGLLVVGLGVLGLTLVYMVSRDIQMLTGFSLGASSIALFCRVGGGIFTKAADVGADLVGKVEAGIPEDDARNPAVIADNVGDNVGDVAGMGADLFESYVGAIVSALMLCLLVRDEKGITFVLMVVAGGILASIIGILVVKMIKSSKVQLVMQAGTFISAGLLIGMTAVLGFVIFGSWMQFLAVLSGIIAGLLIGQITEYYTSAKYKPVKHIAACSCTGSATTILSGLAVGMKSTVIPVLVIVLTILTSFWAGGFFGVILAAVGMLATVGIVVSVDAYGPIADNAGGIAQMSGQSKEVRRITDNLDAVGNTTAAIGKGFSIGSAALTALALFTSYASTVGLTSINLLDPKIISGLFIGGVLTYSFSAMAIGSVSKAADKMILEVRRQFKEFPGIMDGTAIPDYAKCVDISTQASLSQMILPSILAIAAPILTGVILGKGALAGLLAGAIVTGVLLAVKMANAGGAWDNAKKHIEDGNHGGKGGDPHKASVIGDTVGDPLKDTAGPSMNILIKLMSIVALVFAPLFIR